ncbi:MAG: PepSY domain-containing protein [Gemmataceae bacterium]
MRLSVLTRKVHYWAAIVVALPLLVVVVTGLLLQVKKQFTWVQPPERRGTGKEPALALPRVLEVCRGVPEAGVGSWADIDRIDVRPSRGLIKVTTKDNWEVQIDAQTGDVLQVAYRRSDLIEALHDGSWFHPAVKLWVFLPAGLTLFLLLLTGVYLFWLPIVVRATRRRPRPA